MAMEIGRAALPGITVNSELFPWFPCEHSAVQTTADGDQSSLRKGQKEKMNKWTDIFLVVSNQLQWPLQPHSLRKVFRRTKQGFLLSSSAPALARLPGKQHQPRFNPACLNKIRSVSSMKSWVEQQRVRQCGSKGPAIQTEFRLVKYSFSRIITGSCWSRRLNISRTLGQLAVKWSFVRCLSGHYVKVYCCLLV